MTISTRQLVVFASGLALGAAAVAGVWMLVKPSSLRMAENAATIVGTTRGETPPPQPYAPCPAQPAAPIATQKDGKFVLSADLSGNAATDAAAFIVVGKEAAAAGRPRDAEVAFLMACRVADKFKGSGSVESADARYQLAWHYEWLARDGAKPAEILKRADSLYSDSLKSYFARYGQGHEKSRFAADGQASVRQTLAKGQPARHPAPVPAPAPEKPAETTVAGKASETAGPAAGEGATRPARAPAPKSQLREGEIARATLPALRNTVAAERPRPSFDCGKARSVSEKLICSDAELARLDRELGRVYARAKSSASDSALFRRRNNEEWRRRESTCGERQCLLRWYAQRRAQLMEDIDKADRHGPPAPSRQSVL